MMGDDQERNYMRLRQSTVATFFRKVPRRMSVSDLDDVAVAETAMDSGTTSEVTTGVTVPIVRSVAYVGLRNVF